MSLSADFTVEGAANPAAHAVAFGATVDLARTSTQGTPSWEILACSKSGDALPTLTVSTTGATASFPMPADPSDGIGRAFMLRLSVTDGRETVTQYAIVGAVNTNGFVPFVPGEENYRDGTGGWADDLNEQLAASGVPAADGDVTGAVDANVVEKLSGPTGGPFAGFVRLLVALSGDFDGGTPFKWGRLAASFPDDGNYTLGTTDSAEKGAVYVPVVSDVSLTTTRNLVLPLTNGAMYIIKNATTGAQSIVAKGATGTGKTIANGGFAIVFCDGTNYVGVTLS